MANEHCLVMHQRSLSAFLFLENVIVGGGAVFTGPDSGMISIVGISKSDASSTSDAAASREGVSAMGADILFRESVVEMIGAVLVRF